MRAATIGRAMRELGPLRRLGICLLLLPLAGCAELPAQPVVTQDEVAWAGSGAGLLPASGEPAVEDLSSLMHLTPEMVRFAHEVTGISFDVAGKTEALTKAMGDPKRLHIEYDADATLTAEQAFKQRRANCLSYTMLFVAMAREVGIPTRFNEVDIPPIWDLGDDRTSLLYRHINARVELPLTFFLMVDVSSSEYDPAYYQYQIPDEEAMAQFYNNRAVEMRLQQRWSESLRYEVRALELAPQAAYLWDNLASLYMRVGDKRAARVAITQSLKLDPSSMLGYDTASQIYEAIGERQLARYFHERAQFFLDQNPYHHYQLALAALLKHDKQTAFEEETRAILLYPKDSRFFFLMAVVLNQMGDEQRAGLSLQAALELAPDAARQERYKSKYARLAAMRG